MIHYKNYKTTSYDWLPLVPEHWEKKSILTRLRKESILCVSWSGVFFSVTLDVMG